MIASPASGCCPTGQSSLACSLNLNTHFAVRTCIRSALRTRAQVSFSNWDYNSLSLQISNPWNPTCLQQQNSEGACYTHQGFIVWLHRKNCSSSRTWRVLDSQEFLQLRTHDRALILSSNFNSLTRLHMICMTVSRCTSIPYITKLWCNDIRWSPDTHISISKNSCNSSILFFCNRKCHFWRHSSTVLLK